MLPRAAIMVNQNAQMAGSEGGAAASRSGLVLSKTTDTVYAVSDDALFQKSVLVDSQHARVKRLSRTVKNAARCLGTLPSTNTLKLKWLFVTLTMRPDAELQPEDIYRFMKRIRQQASRSFPEWIERVGLRYVWVMELTRAGRPHYHVALAVPKGYTLPKPDKRGWWTHGMTQVQIARHPFGYLAKYLSKNQDGNSFPKGFRMFGVGGLNKVEGARKDLRWWNAPKFARDHFGPGADINRVNGGCIDRITGEFLPSPYFVIFRYGKPFILKKADFYEPDKQSQSHSAHFQSRNAGNDGQKWQKN